MGRKSDDELGRRLGRAIGLRVTGNMQAEVYKLMETWGLGESATLRRLVKRGLSVSQEHTALVENLAGSTGLPVSDLYVLDSETLRGLLDVLKPPVTLR